MKSWKKLLVLLLALVTVLAFAACDKEEPEETEPTLNPGDKDCQHVFTVWEMERERNCTKKGLQTRECTLCGKEEEELIPAFGHVYVRGKCTVCEKEPKECEHNKTEQVIMAEPTCTENGEYRQVCTRCDAVVERTYPDALWHPDRETVLISEASCTVEGVSHEVCKLCGEVAEVNYSDALWHPETERVVVEAPTCTENGTEHEICKLCGEVIWEYTLWYTGHTYEYVEFKDATCEEIGWYDYDKCLTCGYLSGYYEIPATGHTFRADKCVDCGAANPGFQYVSVGDYPHNPYPSLSTGEPQKLDTGAAKIDVFTGELTASGQLDTYTIEVTNSGRHYFWLDGLTGGYVQLYLYDAAGNTVEYDSYCYNKDSFYLALEPGTYTITVKQRNGYSAYNVHVCYKKDIVDISAYDIVTCDMDYKHQVNSYLFTPEISGIYYFKINDMTDSSKTRIYVLDGNEKSLGDKVCGNGEGLSIRLTAGQTYKISVHNYYDTITPCNLYVYNQQATIDLNGYSQVSSAISFRNEKHTYTFTATSGACYINLTGLEANEYLSMTLYRPDGTSISSDSSCYEGDSFTIRNLTLGATYTIVVEYSWYCSPYTLNLYMMQQDTQMSSNTGVKDAIDQSGEIRAYQFTVTESGDHYVLFMVTGAQYVSVDIYNAAGERVKRDTTIRDGNYFFLEDLEAGETYFIYVYEYSGFASYTLSVQTDKP